MKALRTPLFILLLAFMAITNLNAAENIIEDPSCELIQAPNQFGIPFVKWSGWKYEGDAEFAAGKVSHSGKSSCLLIGKTTPKIRLRQEQELTPGRYRVTAYLRGLDIGFGVWNQTTEFMFNDVYIPLDKNGTFGWSKLVYVADVTEPKKVAVSFGLMATGFLWIDDVSLEKVANDVPLTAKPELSAEEAPITPPGPITDGAVACPVCGYKNMPAWNHCFACGSTLETQHTHKVLAPTKLITDFVGNNPFDGGTLVDAPQFEGQKALQIDKSYIALEGPIDWSGYDYLKMDLLAQSSEPNTINIEINDSGTQGYWTRVNYTTIVPAGKSTLILPLKQLFVGEKSRPGRPLNTSSITKFIINIGDSPKAPILLGKMWLENDVAATQVQFNSLYAYDFGTGSSPLMDGFTPISPGTLYNKGRGYGIKTTSALRAVNALQPDPLYQDYICMDSASFAVDLPNGKYQVFVNMDAPAGYWGENQIFHNRSLIIQGKQAINDSMDFNSFKDKYFRFWNTEDLPSNNTFDKYQKSFFQEKQFIADVTNGQLNLDFQGDNCATAVSTIIIYPVSQQSAGDKFLQWLESKRRFYFDNYFKRSLHTATGDALTPSPEDQKRGYILFHRDLMQDVYYNDKPFKAEINQPLIADSFAGQITSLSFSMLPLTDLGIVSIKLSDLVGPAATLPATDVAIGYVSNRISRVTMEGSIYTISPRIIMPNNSLGMPKDITRRIWLTIKTPTDAKPGLYKGNITITTEVGQPSTIPVELLVRKGTLYPVDIPVGPFGYTINIPWFDEALTQAYNEAIAIKSLKTLREYGFTLVSGMPTVYYKGFKDGQPVLDFTRADKEMQLAKSLGFMAVNSYGSGVIGLNAYYQDTDQMNQAGISNYSEFIKLIYSAIQKHADEQQWIPVYWNLADEPLGDDLNNAITNAESYRAAFPKAPPYFTGASSFQGSDTNAPHYLLSKAFHIASLNAHDEAGVNLLHEAGTDWAYYNDASRWTYGEYLYKAVKQFALKFRIAWHWNISAGDPYYALDSREDDYAWFHATPEGQLLPEVNFERIAEGLTDYRMLLTLQGLIKQHPGTPAAIAAEKLLTTRLAAFKLGQIDHDKIYPASDWNTFRKQVADAIEAFNP